MKLLTFTLLFAICTIFSCTNRVNTDVSKKETQIAFSKKKDSLIQLASNFVSTNVDSAIFYSHQLIVLSNKEKSTEGMVEGNLLYAKSLTMLGNYAASAQYANVAYSLSKSIHHPALIGKCLWFQGELNRAARKFPLAITFVKDALVVCKRNHDSTSIGICFNRWSAILYETSDFINTQIYADSALLYLKKGKDDDWRASTFNILGALNTELKRYDNAIKYFEEGLLIYQKDKNDLNIPNILNNIANLHLKKGEFAEAIKLAQKSKSIANQQKIFAYTRVACIVLANSYIALNDYKKAYCYSDSFNKVSMQLYEKNTYIDSLNTNYLNERKDIEKAEAIKADRVELYEAHKLLILSLCFLVILVALSIFMIVQYSQKNKAFQILVKQNKEQLKMEDQLYLKEKQLQKLSSSECTNDICVMETIEDAALTGEVGETSETRLTLVKTKLEILMHEKKAYTDKNISINSLAVDLRTNRTDLSRCINEFYVQNFNTYINSMRIKEAQRLLTLASYNNFTVEGIAELVGFSNKSTFYKAFKQQTGVTPNFYKEHLTD